MCNVLILGGGTQGLALAKDVSRSGHLVFLLGERGNYADSSRYVHKKFYCKFPCYSNEYLDLVRKIINDYSIDTLIPTGDVNAEFLCKNKDILDAKVLMPSYDDFLRATDKNSLMQLCKEKGYPHPYTVNSVDDIKVLDKSMLVFPLLIKPNVTCGARGMTLVNSYEDLVEKYGKIRDEYGECHLQQYVRQGGAQVEVQLYIDENRELVNSSVIYKYRWYPEKGGSSCCAKSVRDERIVNVLYHLLLDLNWVGFADFDTIEDPDTGELLIMELNPRVPACVKCSIEAGIHWGEIIVNGYLGLQQKKYSYKENEFLRHLGFEVLWFLKSPNRFRTSPCWFKFLGRHIHYQDMGGLCDPLPFFIGTLHNIYKLLTNTSKTKVQYGRD